MNISAAIIIILVLGVVVGNLMLLRHTAKIPMKRINKAPIDEAEKRLKNRTTDQTTSSEDN